MKNKRQEAILKLISEKIIVNQEDIVAELIKEGFTKVTQSTISRDIKELRIVKTLDALGNYRYTSAFNEENPTPKNIDKYRDVFKNSVISVKYAMNDVVIRCYPGMASSACVAVDHIYSDLILGSLAGDDTILIVTESIENAALLTEKLSELI